MKRSFYILLFILLTNISFGQGFVKDWEIFTNKKWLIVVNKSTEKLFNQTVEGELVFVNKSNRSIRIIYKVFLKTAVDSSFEKISKDVFREASCRSVDINSKTFPSFKFNDFAYLLIPCDMCNQQTDKKKQCDQLLSQLLKFVEVK